MGIWGDARGSVSFGMRVTSEWLGQLAVMVRSSGEGLREDRKPLGSGYEELLRQPWDPLGWS